MTLVSSTRPNTKAKMPKTARNLRRAATGCSHSNGIDLLRLRRIGWQATSAARVAPLCSQPGRAY
jgi:hypothetical protein